MKTLVCSIVLLLATACGINTSPGYGEKIGQIVKVSRVGMFSDTYEAEIMRGGLQGGSGTVGQSFHFTIPSKEMADQAQKMMEGQKEVLLKYRAEGLFSLSRTESQGHFATSIEEHPAK
jgi:predicted small secreted protein